MVRSAILRTARVVARNWARLASILANYACERAVLPAAPASAYNARRILRMIETSHVFFAANCRESAMKCPQCGVDVVAGAAFCHQCGAATGAAAAELAAPKGADKKHSAGGFIGAPSDEPEVVLWEGTYSKMAMVGAWVVAGGVSLAALVAGLAGRATGDRWLWILAAVALLWAGLVARLFFMKLSTRYFLTGQRLIHERGLLWRTIDRIETIDVDDVSCQQGPVERMLGTGTIRLKSSDNSTPEFALAGIDDVRRVASLIDEARRKERRKRGLYVESV